MQTLTTTDSTRKDLLLQAAISFAMIFALFYIDEGAAFSWIAIPGERMAFALFFALLFGLQVFVYTILLKGYKGKQKLSISIFGGIIALFIIIFLLGIILTFN